ncbi:hypothetical protein GGS23DRAFT_153341 [Durotheca rogersii]|uniref:uncharacterized protein n=1 Tax=Durotheca rogersii TaxID=419775 RepID=UPI0022200C44|nr:uncharacterized protein GGS23DRAFT_153341 [Durotheca rogersii]KAI5861119.1 hypothetical protein GGS23DRAFT_153341 [Durotheca rogersii]
MTQPLTFLVAFSAVVGASEAIRQIQSDARRKEHRSRKNNLILRCLKSCQYSHILEGRRVVLSGDKLYIDTGTDYEQVFGHPFAGYFLPYPDTKHSGLVSTICEEPPIMNWIYVDRSTYELKFGTRPQAQANWPGPFDCTRQDHRLTFNGWEGFFVVREGDFWALYFDVDQDGLKAKVGDARPVLEVELLRVEMRVKPVKQEKQLESGVNAEAKCGNEEPSDGVNGNRMNNIQIQRGTEGPGLDSPDVD